MDQELKKDLEFIADVIEEFVEKHKDRLSENGYLTLYHISGSINISSSVMCENRIDYDRKKQ